jgi:hypothetical protein
MKDKLIIYSFLNEKDEVIRQELFISEELIETFIRKGSKILNTSGETIKEFLRPNMKLAKTNFVRVLLKYIFPSGKVNKGEIFWTFNI